MSTASCSVANTPLMPVATVWAISLKEILSNVPLRVSAIASPNCCHPVSPSWFFVDISSTNPSRVFQRIINLLPSAFPSSVQLTSSSIPRSPVENFFPRFSKSMPSGPNKRLNVLTSVLIPAPMVLPRRSQSRLSSKLLNDSVKALQNFVIFGPTFFQFIAS